MTAPFHPKRILLVGASGGIGGALARHYARPGVHLTLWGRDMGRLAAVAEACRAAGASADVRSLDITDLDAAQHALAAEDEARPIDLALFASGAGDTRATSDKVEAAGLVARLAAINFAAPATLAAALGGRMAERGHGSIVLIGSAAAFHALPFAAAYSGTKAGLARFAEALRLGLREHGITVTLVSPGFVDTAAGREVPGPKPLMLAPNELAARIARAAALGRAHLVTPWPFVLLRLLDRVLPRTLRERLLLALAPPGG